MHANVPYSHTRYESEKKARKVVDAQELWMAILNSQVCIYICHSPFPPPTTPLPQPFTLLGGDRHPIHVV